MRDLVHIDVVFTIVHKHVLVVVGQADTIACVWVFRFSLLLVLKQLVWDVIGVQGVGAQLLK